MILNRTRMEAAAEALRGARRITAICHENPDADTLGAAVAVALIGRRLGADTEVVAHDRPPAACSFLPLFERITPRPRLEPDLAVVCDAATLDRVGQLRIEAEAWFSRARTLNIDHHATNAGWGDLNLVDPDAAATCQIIAELLPVIDLEPDADIATALLAGIVRDSQGFADEATSPATLRVSADLIEAGASLARVQRHLLTEMPYQTVALWGRVLGTVGQAAGGEVIHATLTTAMLDETATQQGDADGLVEFLARSRPARMAILFRELADGTRVSIRAEAGDDAVELARRFGGGGHAHRAGFIVEEPLAVVRASVLTVAAEILGRPS